MARMRVIDGLGQGVINCHCLVGWLVVKDVHASSKWVMICIVTAIVSVSYCCTNAIMYTESDLP